MKFFQVHYEMTKSHALVILYKLMQPLQKAIQQYVSYALYISIIFNSILPFQKYVLKKEISYKHSSQNYL